MSRLDEDKIFNGYIQSKTVAPTREHLAYILDKHFGNGASSIYFSPDADLMFDPEDLSGGSWNKWD